MKQNSRGKLSYQDQMAQLLAQMGGIQSEPDPREKAKKQQQLDAEKKKLESEKAARLARAKRVLYRPNKAEAADFQLRKRRLAEQHASANTQKHVSRAKAAGLKSMLTIGNDQLLMTSFGKGNDAVLEKKIIGEAITDLNATPAFSARVNEDQFVISGRMMQNAPVDNPASSVKKAGDDLIGCREQLEQMFFGSTFEDNIHIQLAYSILDIDKILAIHINNIVYQLNNMLRDDTEGQLVFHDVVGNIGLERTGEEFWKSAGKQMKEDVKRLLEAPQLAYFGSVLYDGQLVKNIKKARNPLAKERAQTELKAKEDDAFNLLTLLGMIRQALAHGEEGKRTTIYTLDEGYDSMYAKNQVSKVNSQQRIAARKTLDALYAERIADLNDGFLQKAKVDLRILFSIYNALLPEDKKEIVQEYYDFIVRKEYKNQGFSIKHLRELMLTQPDASHILSCEYDSMRSRLYRMIDLMLFRYYRANEARMATLVESLRGSTDEAQKESFYAQEAAEAWKALGASIAGELLPWMNGEELKDAGGAAGDPDVTADMIREIALKPNTFEFCKLIYLMTCFLDGKEINDLLTTLINKFETIASFIAVMKEQDINCKFIRGYGMFNNSHVIARELRAINSFARMSKPEQDARRILFIEAAEVLGFSGDAESLNKYVDEMLTEKGDFIGRGKGFRNFIANNVIESDRFKYLVRYANVKTVRRIADNKNVVSFVLQGIPDTQIIRYYNSCTGSAREDCTPDMREGLANLIAGISFRQFEGVQQKARGNTPEAQDKVRKQAIIRLYLAVLYLAVKNLVYVNSRYFLAFHCVERDSIICNAKYQEVLTGRSKDFAAFAKDRVAEGKLNSKATKYIQQNIANSDPLMVQGFRNCVDHLGAVRYADQFIGDIASVDSYFSLYHYLVQRYLLADYEQDAHVTEDMLNPKMLLYFKLIQKHRSYCKDMVKALNVPFAYNLPRYKNLSIDDLFDRNHYLPEKGKNIALNSKNDE